jgi:hypothetical protein
MPLTTERAAHPMTAVLTWVLGCGSAPPPPPGPTTVPTYEGPGSCVVEPGVTGLAPPEHGAWLQYLITRGDRPMRGFRIYVDGRYEAFREGSWQPGRELAADELATVRTAVVRADIASWRSYRVYPPSADLPDPEIEVDLWTSAGSWHRTVGDNCAFEPLSALIDTLNRDVAPLGGRTL